MYPDFIVGAPQGSTNSKVKNGYAIVMFGNKRSVYSDITVITSGTHAPNMWIVHGGVSGDMLGFSLAGGQDFDGDTVPDMALGAPGWSTNRGYIAVLFGKTAEAAVGYFNTDFELSGGVSESNGFVMTGPDVNTQLGSKVALLEVKYTELN
jgi:hypothetical protein